MRGENVIGIVIGDIHLSHKPPIARSVEKDWYGVMGGYLDQVENLAWKYSAHIICTGDIFDKTDPPLHPPIQLVNFALDKIGHWYAVPGQHDLPNHRYSDIKKSGVWALVKAKKVTLLEPNKPIELGCIRLHGFPWGFDIKFPSIKPDDFLLEIAVAHAYIWSSKKNTGYPGAPPDKTIGCYKKKLEGFGLGLFGDNHKSTFYNLDKNPIEDITIFNPGSFMRRKIDEIDHKPCVGLLRSDGSVTPHYLDVSNDQFIEKDKADKILGELGMETLIEELMNLSDAAISYSETLNKLMEKEKVSPEVKDLILAFRNKK